MKNKFYLTALTLLLIISSFGQNISGYWKGTTLQRRPQSGIIDTFQIYYKIDQLDWRIKGTSTIIDKAGDSTVMMINGRVFKNNIDISETKILFSTSNQPDKIHLKKHNLSFSTTAKYKRLDGSIESTDHTGIDRKVKVTKLKNLEPSNRKKFRTAKSSVIVYLYDNRQSDGDRVSILINNQVILENFEVSKKHKKIKVPIDATILENKLVFRAENLGEIPPNTAIIKIKNGKETKTFQMEASLEKSDIIHIKSFHAKPVKVVNQGL